MCPFPGPCILVLVPVARQKGLSANVIEPMGLLNGRI